MSDEAIVKESRIAVPYTWSAGETGSRFLKTLRDEQKIVGTRCPDCKNVFVPARKTCGRCFKECAEWLDVGPQGKLVSFTRANYESPAHPVSQPWYGLIRLDGADNSILHLLGELSEDGPQPGMTVEPVFSEERCGHILDIRYFKPV
ncbi:MAG: DNA-binding protein [Elusimicrobia bacterium]|nr:MAG: DNA-binding protein [Elusimicrobiota bacterium]